MENTKSLSFFDTHCHLSSEDYDDFQVNSIIDDAKKNNVKHIINVGYDMFTNNRLILQSKNNEDFLFSAIGIHPNSDDDLNEDNLVWIEDKIVNEKIFAIGEIGLDYYRNKTPIEKQKFFFEKQLILAKKYNLPVLIHVRDAFEDTYEIIKSVGISKGVIHCFTGDLSVAKKFLDLGFYISFSGIITFPKSEKIHEVISYIPIDKILVETDSPYLSPNPFRGAKNHPWNVKYNIEKIALIRGFSFEKMSEIIFFNTLKFLFL
ncbi:MAG: putative metal-dependent hydrolase YcfH [Mycoplasmataceae bacterium]|nr:MAG: putative metal-dependent hydrolase YcfH [Mycoplasmataceae bacterium]